MAAGRVHTPWMGSEFPDPCPLCVRAFHGYLAFVMVSSSHGQLVTSWALVWSCHSRDNLVWPTDFWNSAIPGGLLQTCPVDLVWGLLLYRCRVVRGKARQICRHMGTLCVFACWLSRLGVWRKRLGNWVAMVVYTRYFHIEDIVWRSLEPAIQNENPWSGFQV